MRRYLVGIVVVAIVAVGIVTWLQRPGSSGDRATADSPREEPQLGAVLEDPTEADIVLPVSGNVPFREQAIQDLAVQQAQDETTAECMVAAGFPLPPSPPAAVVEENPDGERYGLIDPEHAQRYGYHPAPYPPDVQARIDFQASAVTSNRQELALYSEGGCLDQARAATGVDAVERARSELEAALVESFDLAMADSRVEAVMGRWRDCMERSGYTYGTLWDANDDPRWDPELPPSQEEIETALADVACKREVNLVGTLMAVEQAYQEELLRSQPGLVHNLNEALRRQQIALEERAEIEP
ncbi:MAG: hypothetical protein JNK12_23735 [Acidimicrobiales bacterium]|nr:hypothetical protein [Acidimicrobiales bacterium]